MTFVICLGMLILFRRLDKSNMKMTKLRRYSDKMFDDFRLLAETEKRKFNDATIEMDILIKKSNALTTNLAMSIKEIESRLTGLNVEKENLRKVEDDIKVISNAAREVNKQIEFISMAKSDFGDMAERINLLQQNMTTIRGESNNVLNTFNNRVRERSRELMEEFSSIVNGHISSFSEKEEQVLSLRNTLTDLENTVFADIKLKSDEMKNSMNRAVNEFDASRDTLFRRLDDDIEKVYSKLKNVETTVDSSKTDLIETFQKEVDRVRKEFDALSIHTIAKKDEIVQVARNEAEDIRKKIEDYQDKILQYENRLVTTAENKINYIENEFETISNKVASLSEKTKNEFSVMDRHLNDIKNEIIQYEKQNGIFEKTDTLISKVDSSITQLTGMLETAQKESASIQKFMDETDELREIRKSVNNEIVAYQARREKLEDVENNIHNLMEMSDLALNRMDLMKDNIAKIDFINARIDSLGESYSELDGKIEELKEYEGAISKNIESVNRSEQMLRSVETKLSGFQKVLERSDKKVDKMNDYLREVEEKTLILKTRKNEIQEIKDKFEEIDGIGDVMSKRVDQIYAMFKKVETLRNEIDETDTRLQNMFTRTDEKMKEFADFIQSVDANSIISKQVKKEQTPGKNINEHLIKTVRELSNRGWTPDAIAKKMLLDENSVRFIINTTSI
jgi:DNA repair exonuclease SbcCD ATPase subunit